MTHGGKQGKLFEKHLAGKNGNHYKNKHGFICVAVTKTEQYIQLIYY